MFPIGDMLKPEVRRIAAEQQLATAKRKDSQGICFVGKVDLPLFLQQKLAPRQGDIVEIAADWPGYAEAAARTGLEEMALPYRYTPADGVKVGEHNGAHYYTIGQRKGLGVSGRAEPLSSSLPIRSPIRSMSGRGRGTPAFTAGRCGFCPVMCIG